MADLDERHMTTVVVADVERWDEDWPPTKLPTFLIWLGDKMALIPEEYRSNAEIEIGAYTDYDSAEANLTVSYDRPETDDDARIRLERADALKGLIAERERATLAQLKAKYES